MRKPFSAYLIGLMTLVAASWPTTMVEAQTAQQIAAELFDYPIHEIGDPSVLGAKFGCDVSLIDTWDELQMVLLLAAFDPNQLQAALHGLAGQQESKTRLWQCAETVHRQTCNPKGIDFVAPSVTGAIIGGVGGAVAERVIGGPLGALMNPATGAGVGAGGALLHLGVCNKRKDGAMQALREVDIGDHAQQLSDVTLTNVLLTYRDARQRLDPAAWAIVAEHTRGLEKSAIESVPQVR
jgi:hypothetical protein